MFGRRDESRRAERPVRPGPGPGNRLASRSGELSEDTFPWEDDLVVAAAEARRERRLGQAAPSVVLEPSIVVESLAMLGVQVLQLAD
jgi:hypothetical protein